MSRIANTFLLGRVDAWGASHQIPKLSQLLNSTPTSAATGAEFAVQLPVEARPVVDDCP